MPYLIAFAAAVFVFCIIWAAATGIMKNSLEVKKRMTELRTDRAEPEQKKKIKRIRAKKTDKNAIQRTKKYLEKLENQLFDAGLKLPVQQFLMIWAGGTVIIPVVLLIVGIGGIICAIVAVVCAIAPILYLSIRRSKRKKELESQLIEAISVLCNALRAGHSFQQAMNSIAQEMTGPVAEEFGRVFRETQHGMTLEDSMNRMVERTGSADVEMLTTAILIQREVGGNLAEVLENISGTIRSRLSLKKEIKTRTSSGRLSGYIVGALPIILLIIMYVMNPEYAGQLINTNAGHIMLIVGGVLEVIGFLVIQKMVTIKY